MKIHFRIDSSAIHLLKKDGEAYIRVSLKPFDNFSYEFLNVELAEKVLKMFGKDTDNLLKNRWNQDGTINFLYIGKFPEENVIDKLGDYHASAYCHQHKPVDKLFISLRHLKDILGNIVFNDKMLNQLIEIADLSGNWDGNDAVPVKETTLLNAVRFLTAVFSSDEYVLPEPDDVYPTPYGSLVIDFNTKDGLVSTEVGNSDFGFFTDFTGNGNYGVDGYTNDFVKMPVPESVKKFILKVDNYVQSNKKIPK